MYGSASSLLRVHATHCFVAALLCVQHHMTETGSICMHDCNCGTPEGCGSAESLAPLPGKLHVLGICSMPLTRGTGALWRHFSVCRQGCCTATRAVAAVAVAVSCVRRLVACTRCAERHLNGHGLPITARAGVFFGLKRGALGGCSQPSWKMRICQAREVFPRCRPRCCASSMAHVRNLAHTYETHQDV